MTQAEIISITIATIGAGVACLTYVAPRVPRKRKAARARAKYIAGLEELYKEADRKLEALGPWPKIRFWPPATRLVPIVERYTAMATIHEELLAAWRKMRIPAGDDDKIAEMLELQKRAVVELWCAASATQDRKGRAHQEALDKFHEFDAALYAKLENYGVRFEADGDNDA